jgi:hypothetical protein
VVREVPRGVQWETVIIYDLDLPTDFHPVNQDGEVSEFKLLAFPEVERQIADGAMAYEAALAAQDYHNRRQARAP